MDAETLFKQAEQAEESGDLAAALDLYSQAIVMDPGHALAWNSRGLLYYRMGEVERAAADYGRAIALAREPVFFFNRGRAHAGLGRWAEAIEDFTGAIALDPGDALAYGDRAYAHSRTRNLDRAIADYTRAMELDPAATGYRYSRGVLSLMKGEAAAAVSDLDGVIAAEPRNALAYYHRGLARRALGDREGSEADLRTALAHAGHGQLSALIQKALAGG